MQASCMQRLSKSTPCSTRQIQAGPNSQWARCRGRLCSGSIRSIEGPPSRCHQLRTEEQRLFQSGMSLGQMRSKKAYPDGPKLLSQKHGPAPAMCSCCPSKLQCVQSGCLLGLCSRLPDRCSPAVGPGPCGLRWAWSTRHHPPQNPTSPPAALCRSPSPLPCEANIEYKLTPLIDCETTEEVRAHYQGQHQCRLLPCLCTSLRYACSPC